MGDILRGARTLGKLQLNVSSRIKELQYKIIHKISFFITSLDELKRVKITLKIIV